MEREERKSEKAYTAAASNKKKGDYTTQGGRKKSEVDGSVVCHNKWPTTTVDWSSAIISPVYYRSESKRKAPRIAPRTEKKDIIDWRSASLCTVKKNNKYMLE